MATKAPIHSDEDSKLVIWLVLDKTGSMAAFGGACCDCFTEIFSVLSILGAGAVSLRFLAYGDYDTPRAVTAMSAPGEAARTAMEATRIGGGSDAPEAVKTAFHELLNEISHPTQAPSQLQAEPTDADPALGQHVVFLFTDAPPHHEHTGSEKGHITKERERLGGNFDWLTLRGKLLAAGVSTFTFVPARTVSAIGLFYAALGPIISLREESASAIAGAIVTVFTYLIGEVPPDGSCPPPTFLRVLQTTLDYDAFPDESFLVPPGATAETKQHTPCEFKVASDVAGALVHGRAAGLLGGTLRDLPQALKRDPAFRLHVIEQLEPLLVPAHVRVLMSNPALGKVWRALCGFRRHDERIAGLCDSLSLAVQADEEMQSWLLGTYNSQEEIDELLAPCTSRRRFVLRGSHELPSLKDTLAVMRGTFACESVTMIVSALREVELVVVPDAEDEQSTESDTVEGLPDDLSDGHLFATLLHLLHPGMLATARAAAVTAALVASSGASGPLAERAEALLTARHGTWSGADDPATYPEVYGVGFFLLARRVRHHLTPHEASFFERVWYVWRLRRTLACKITVRIGKQLRGGKPETLPDHRATCTCCHVSRPTSLLVEGVCGLCLLEPPVDTVPAPACAADGCSHMVQCRVPTCRARYAVERPHLLNVVPKCYYCRGGRKCPVVTCATCHCRSVMPDQPAVAGAWTCAACSGGRDNTEEMEVALGALLEENEGLGRVLDFAVPQGALQPSVKLAAAFKKYGGVITAQEATVEVPLTWQGAKVLNCAAVCASVAETVRSADIVELCGVCFQVRALMAMGSACGGCNTLVCADCRGEWYRLRPGQFPVWASRLCCPFCRQRPQPPAAFFGRRNMPRRIEEDEGMVLGYCAQCRVVQGALPQDCAGGELRELDDWMCDGCKEAELALAAQQAVAGAEDEAREVLPLQEGFGRGRAHRLRCPGCGFLTEKAGGCNHMTCVVCAAHWCWQCGVEFSAATIYDHMEHAHGGIGL